MRDAIIRHSIEGLLTHGLRFSIDEVAKSLKISKKTIYKYFATKEDLAIEMYKTYYENALQQLAQISGLPQKDAVAEMLAVYYRSHCMVRNEIFNKYALNTNIRALAQTSHNSIRNYVENFIPQSDKTAVMIIIDGALQKLCENKSEETNVIRKLTDLICLLKF